MNREDENEVAGACIAVSILISGIMIAIYHFFIA